jgi:cysteine desulfurase
MLNRPVYLDHHAATPLCAAAKRAMAEAESSAWANPASVHAAGRKARSLLERAREQIAAAIGAQPAELVLTSGGTEACNLGVLGAASAASERGGHLLTTAIEHPAVAKALARRATERGAELTALPVLDGIAPDPAALRAALRPDTRLAALQWINHETGSVLPIAEYAAVCRGAGVALFVDATQGLGKLPCDVHALGVDLMAFAAHKLGGPSGAGALWVRRGVALEPMLEGGAQEHGLRAGTPDVLSAVGFGAACAELPERLAAQPRLRALQTRADAALRAHGGAINGAGGLRSGTVSNASFRGTRGDELVAALDLEGVHASSGAACSSGLSAPSSVLQAMYPAEAWRAESALRLSFGPETSETDVENALAALARVLPRVQR